MSSQRARVAIAILVVVAVTAIILDLRGGQGPFATIKGGAGAVVAGAERVGATVSAPFLGVRDWWGTWGDQRALISELEAENERLASVVRRSENDRNRANALDGLLRVAGVGRYEIVPAEVVAIGPAQQLAWTVTIDAGRDDGIEQDMSVINGDGLVGRVQSVRGNSATVVLVVDKTVSVGARVAGTGEVGILSGTGDQHELTFQVLDPLAPMNAGDALVTFGSKGGRPFAPGIPIGEVLSVSGTAGQLTRVASIRPYADMSRLSIVGVVVRPPRGDPRDSVLPDRPSGANTPAPAPSPSARAESDASAVEEESAATPVPSAS